MRAIVQTCPDQPAFPPSPSKAPFVFFPLPLIMRRCFIAQAVQGDMDRDGFLVLMFTCGRFLFIEVVCGWVESNWGEKHNIQFIPITLNSHWADGGKRDEFQTVPAAPHFAVKLGPINLSLHMYGIRFSSSVTCEIPHRMVLKTQTPAKEEMKTVKRD